MKDDDLYARHQTLLALVGVLLHDLRNPLHNATLLVEARTMDPEVLRTKLRSQFGKQEALIAEAAGAMRELAVEPRIREVGVDEVLRAAVEMASHLAEEASFELPAESGLKITTDPAMLARAIAEVAIHLGERSRLLQEKAAKPIKITVQEPDADSVRLGVGELPQAIEDGVNRQPFTIAGGGIHLAMARALSQSAGVKLRLEQTPGAPSRFTMLAPRPR